MNNMTNRRVELDGLLREVLGSNNVYYQPPETVKMKYPAIVYERSNVEVTWADNNPYRNLAEYEITYIDPKPDNDILERLLKKFNWVRFARHFTADNLNHDVLYLNF